MKLYLWDQVFEGIHDLRALRLLVVGETSSDDDHTRKHHTQIQLWQSLRCFTSSTVTCNSNYVWDFVWKKKKMYLIKVVNIYIVINWLILRGCLDTVSQ